MFICARGLVKRTLKMVKIERRFTPYFKIDVKFQVIFGNFNDVNEHVKVTAFGPVEVLRWQD